MLLSLKMLLQLSTNITLSLCLEEKTSRVMPINHTGDHTDTRINPGLQLYNTRKHTSTAQNFVTLWDTFWHNALFICELSKPMFIIMTMLSFLETLTPVNIKRKICQVTGNENFSQHVYSQLEMGVKKRKVSKFILKLWANVPVDILDHLFNHECLSMAYQYYVLIWKVQACKSKIAPEVNCCRHQKHSV